MKLRRTLTCLFLAVSSIVVANGDVKAITDQDIACSDGGTFSIFANEVISGSSCAGSAVIPDGVTQIGNSAFTGAPITSITISASVTEISNYAFYNTSNLNSVTFETGSQLATIAPHAFEAAISLTSINVPASVTVIGSGAFYNATSLTSVSFPPNSLLTILGDSVFVGATSLQTIVLPDTITEIGSSAFLDTSLSRINVPASVVSIGASAFANLTTFTEVTFSPGSQLTHIGNYAFVGTRLVNVLLPEGLTSIPASAFDSVGTLVTVQIPSTVTQIGDRAFAGTTSLQNVYFTSGSMLTSIGNFAFNQAGVQSLTIPASVTTIGLFSIHDLPNLSKLGFLGDKPTVADTYSISFLPADQKMVVKHSNSTFGDLSASPVWDSEGEHGDIPIVAGYTMTFNANSADTGLPPQPVLAESGTAFSLPENFGDLKLTGKQFIGWNTEPDGTGTSYEPGDTWIMAASDGNLYARWGQRATSSVKPTITGTASVGSQLTANRGTWSGTPTPTYAYQWYQCTAPISVARDSVPDTCATISGALDTNLTLNSTHANKYISVAVTATSAGTDPTVWMSQTSSKVTMRAAATKKPTISGKAKVGSTLTGNKGTWTGAPTPTYTYQWYACTSSSSTAKSSIPVSCKRINGASGTRLVVRSTYRNKFLAVAVIAKSGTTSPTTWISKTTAKVQ